VSADPARAALDRRVLDFLCEATARGFARDDARFEALALDLFAYQFERCSAYRKFCEMRGRTPALVRHADEIPSVPTGIFKELRLATFAPERTVQRFRTSGTSTRKRGVLELDTLALYEASLLPTLDRLLFPDFAAGARRRLRLLVPAPAEAPDSSLTHMCAVLLRERGDAQSGFDVVNGELRVDALLRALAAACAEREPTALLGTALAFVHLLDALDARGARIPLPPGSRVMETGGFKGRSREISRDELHARISEALGLAPTHVVNQYGMTELASQFYDSTLAQPERPRRKLGPPWARVRVLDPATGDPAVSGAIGSLSILDLANTGSVIAIQTADLGRAVEDGFEVLGREVGAEVRGCSIAADLLLGPGAA
jgi:hypothetical protein